VPAQTIAEFFATPIPTKLWHYTSVDALESILFTQKIWATEAHHTTDPSEFIHAHSIAADYLARARGSDRAARLAKDSGEGLLKMAFGQDGPLSAEHHQVYIASFSRSPDKRSQWQSYASQATGVSIAFDLRGIRPPQEMDSGISFAPCVYIDREKEHLLEEALRLWSNAREEVYRQSEHVPTVRAWYHNQRSWDRFLGPSSREELFARKKKELEEIIRPAIYRASFELLRLAAHCKEGKYVDEDEWRLSLPHKAGKVFKHNELQFRGPQNIPFVAHNLFNFGLPVTEIMLGANCTALTRIRTLLKTRGLDIPITSSQLPW
jgi:hypothetical protein